MNLFDKIAEIVKNQNSHEGICFALSEQDIEQIFTACVYHGIFSEKNSGFYDRKNSVFCWLGPLVELKKVSS